MAKKKVPAAFDFGAEHGLYACNRKATKALEAQGIKHNYLKFEPIIKDKYGHYTRGIEAYEPVYQKYGSSKRLKPETSPK